MRRLRAQCKTLSKHALIWSEGWLNYFTIHYTSNLVGMEGVVMIEVWYLLQSFMDKDVFLERRRRGTCMTLTSQNKEKNGAETLSANEPLLCGYEVLVGVTL